MHAKTNESFVTDSTRTSGNEIGKQEDLASITLWENDYFATTTTIGILSTTSSPHNFVFMTGARRTTRKRCRQVTFRKQKASADGSGMTVHTTYVKITYGTSEPQTISLDMTKSRKDYGTSLETNDARTTIGKYA